MLCLAACVQLQQGIGLLGMSFNLRDAQVTVIHIDETTVRGIKGQSELFRRPSVVSNTLGHIQNEL